MGVIFHPFSTLILYNLMSINSVLKYSNNVFRFTCKTGFIYKELYKLVGGTMSSVPVSCVGEIYVRVLETRIG